MSTCLEPTPVVATCALPGGLIVAQTRYYNTEQTVTLTCGPGTVGDPVTATAEAGAFSSTESQEVADALALAAATVEANQLRLETPCQVVYESLEVSATSTCGEGTVGDPITVTLPAGSFTSLVSVEAATAAAQAEADAQVAALRLATPCTVPSSDQGEVYTYGWNQFGVMGVPTSTTFHTVPTKVGTDTSWVDISEHGASHVVAIKADGTLWAWGNNSQGQLGQGDTTALDTPTQIGTATNWRKCAAGTFFSAAINSANELWMWGTSYVGQLGQGDLLQHKTPVQVPGSWSMVACGDIHVAAIKTDGTLWTWGDDLWGKLGDGTSSSSGGNKNAPFNPSPATNWVFVTCGKDATLMINSLGELWGMGCNGNGNEFTIGLDGMFDIGVPTRIGADSDWAKVANSNWTTYALKTDGRLFSVGINSNGETGLGNPTFTHTTVFTQIGTDLWKDVSTFFSAGGGHAVAIKLDGTLWGWGENNNYECGLGFNSTAQTSPALASADTNWIKCKAGRDRFSIALKKVV